MHIKQEGYIISIFHATDMVLSKIHSFFFINYLYFRLVVSILKNICLLSFPLVFIYLIYIFTLDYYSDLLYIFDQTGDVGNCSVDVVTSGGCQLSGHQYWHVTRATGVMNINLIFKGD